MTRGKKFPAPLAPRIQPFPLKPPTHHFEKAGTPRCVTIRRVVTRALDSHPLFPSRAASGRCVLSAAVAGAPAGVVSAFAEPSRWCAGAVLVAAGAVCALAVPSDWRTDVALVFAVV